jgi:hypothetical protein
MGSAISRPTQFSDGRRAMTQQSGALASDKREAPASDVRLVIGGLIYVPHAQRLH